MVKGLLKVLGGGVLVVALALFFMVIDQQPQNADASTSVGNDYNATSTRYFPGTSLTNLTVLKNNPGALARVTITGANTGIIRIWNATTSNVDLRTGNRASSSLKFVEIPASTVAGVYDFDMEFETGMLYELVSGNAPTSTIVYR